MDTARSEKVIGLERRLHDPEVRRNLSKVAELLADGFVEFGASGRVYSKAEILVALAAESPAGIKAEGFVASELVPGVVLLTYRTVAGDLAALRSSIWVEDVARWRMVFHQGTPVSP